MTEFERELAKAFNRFFADHGIDGIAYRRKQHRFSSQFCDLLVDSADPNYYLAIENKSIKTASANKLYFSQHFSETNDGLHQVDRITDFLTRSGRKGFLAVEMRRGRGKPRKAFLVPWTTVRERFETGEKGIALGELSSFYEMERDGEDYDLRALFGDTA